MLSIKTYWPDLTAYSHHAGQWKWAKVMVKINNLRQTDGTTPMAKAKKN